MIMFRKTSVCMFKFKCSILVELTLYSVEAVVQRCSVKKVFLEISKNSQENTCARVFFLVTSY